MLGLWFVFVLCKMTNACLLARKVFCDKLVKKCFIIWIDVFWFDCFYCSEAFAALNCLPSPVNIRAECASSVLLRRYCGGPTARRKKRKWRLPRWNRFPDVPVPGTQPYSLVCIRSHLKSFFPLIWAQRNGYTLMLFMQLHCDCSCISKTKNVPLPLLTILDR